MNGSVTSTPPAILPAATRLRVLPDNSSMCCPLLSGGPPWPACGIPADDGVTRALGVVQLPLSRSQRARQHPRLRGEVLSGVAAAPRRVEARGILPLHPGTVQQRVCEEGRRAVPPAGAPSPADHADDARPTARERRCARAAPSGRAGPRAAGRACDVHPRRAAPAAVCRRRHVDGRGRPHRRHHGRPVARCAHGSRHARPHVSARRFRRAALSGSSDAYRVPAATHSTPRRGVQAQNSQGFTLACTLRLGSPVARCAYA